MTKKKENEEEVIELAAWPPEVIEKEIKGLKDQIAMWKQSYIDQGILDEETIACFDIEIEEQIYPYVRRLRDLCIVTPQKAEELLAYAERELEDLKRISAERQSLGLAKVEFYYSTGIEPKKKFKSDVEKCKGLLKQLQDKKIKVSTTDTYTLSRKEIDEKTQIAMSIQEVEKRGIIGSKDAKREWFGAEVPVLMIFEREIDKNPKEVYPRREKKKLVGCEEALQRIADKLK